jgi:hypothetical protein
MDSQARQYFHRASWALHNSTNDKLEPIVKSHLMAMAVHACQSLREHLDYLAAEKTHAELNAALKILPHAQLIENIRNMDLHGWPLPICDPRVIEAAMVSKPGQPVQLTSSHGVGVSLQMHGPKPKVRRTRKDLRESLKHANVTFEHTVSWQCDNGRLIVHDFSTGKDYLLLEVLRSFLQQCEALVFPDDAGGKNAPAPIER